MQTNTLIRTPQFTHEGAPSSPVSNLQRLKRLTMACMLWEDTFYVDGKTIALEIDECCKYINPNKIALQAVEAHEKGNLRHVPLYLLVQALKYKANCSEAIYKICSRPDQMTELLSLYWKNGRVPLAAQLKKGLAKAFTRFDRYQLAKYNRNNPIMLRDVLFLTHAKPKNSQQAQDWKDLVDGTLEAPDTWEVRLSAGHDKKESFQELLEAGKMGRLAIIRNLRNMKEAGISKDLVERELLKKSRPLLPFQFLAAAKECPGWEDMIDQAMVSSLVEKEKLPGNTLLLVDVSGSMVGEQISQKSKMDRLDAACGMAILLREICQNVRIATFSNALVEVPPRRGMALRDAILISQPNGNTYLGNALTHINNHQDADKFDRIIVITDEQCADKIPKMKIPKCYILNIANYRNGIENRSNWLTISGFSEAAVDYILEVERDI